MSRLVMSRLVMSRLVMSRLVMSRLVMSRLVMSRLVMSRLVMSRLFFLKEACHGADGGAGPSPRGGASSARGSRTISSALRRLLSYVIDARISVQMNGVSFV